MTTPDRKRVKAMWNRLKRRGGCDMHLSEFEDFVISSRLRTPKGIVLECMYHGANLMPPSEPGYMHLADAQIDHFTPLSRGGTGERHNLWFSCGTCNRRKGSLTGTEFLKLIDFVNEMDSKAQAYIWGKLGAKPSRTHGDRWEAKKKLESANWIIRGAKPTRVKGLVETCS